MPTVLLRGPYRFHFFAGDSNEPAHIHVERDNNSAKFWLEPIRLHRSGGFNRREINRIRRLIEENHTALLGRWYDYFTD